MENFLLYFAKVNGLIILFYLLYLVLLRKETFYVSNRWYLLMGLVTSIILPLITFTKTIWVNPEPISKFIEEVPLVADTSIRTVSEALIDWSLIYSAAYGLITIVILLKVGFEIASFFFKIVKLNKEKETIYDPKLDANLFTFYMIDKDTIECKVILHKNKPQDFERSEQIVLIGEMQGQEFHASDILMKCPSKYNEGKTEVAANENILKI